MGKRKTPIILTTVENLQIKFSNGKSVVYCEACGRDVLMGAIDAGIWNFRVHERSKEHQKNVKRLHGIPRISKWFQKEDDETSTAPMRTQRQRPLVAVDVNEAISVYKFHEQSCSNPESSTFVPPTPSGSLVVLTPDGASQSVLKTEQLL
ncbi:hypothetical protein SISNIDRAFT_457061 [Sistotremastrum niveocremeum HHB9708]|uniref:Uncharacterized protein n=2 Tax=Sistotremastraceae TaxID=3402574 RepID=A0A164S1Q4_9AGAM|nr:hypothetical protein SISNIDRAFT_457061 [Sistotremastrum niveocremeum HHB9708]KZT32439.1 hypothetical protein SISSUDRAFT_1055530 [Sistotremastrum suecicum HHB10207 ss-3]